MAERSDKVSGLAEHLYNLKTSKSKGLEREQVDEIVKMIKEIDNEGKHVDSLGIESTGISASERWAEAKLREKLAEADQLISDQSAQV